MKLFWQGRVWADSADEAAMKVRDKHPTATRVTLHLTHVVGWYEYGASETVAEPVPK